MGRARWGNRGAVWGKSNIVPFVHLRHLSTTISESEISACQFCAFCKPRNSRYRRVETPPDVAFSTAFPPYTHLQAGLPKSSLAMTAMATENAIIHSPLRGSCRKILCWKERLLGHS